MNIMPNYRIEGEFICKNCGHRENVIIKVIGSIIDLIRGKQDIFTCPLCGGETDYRIKVTKNRDYPWIIM